MAQKMYVISQWMEEACICMWFWLFGNSTLYRVCFSMSVCFLLYIFFFVLLAFFLTSERNASSLFESKPLRYGNSSTMHGEHYVLFVTISSRNGCTDNSRLYIATTRGHDHFMIRCCTGVSIISSA